MTIQKPIVIISGATATGKTALSIQLGKELQQQKNISSEVVNFDSLLFYRELAIGTARPGRKQMADIPHHLVGQISISKDFNAADFVHQAKQIIEQIHARGNLPLLVGGSGFYLRALVKGMWEMKKVDTHVRQWVRQQYQNQGISALFAILKDKDQESLKTIHPNDHYRLARACEYVLETGEAISQQKKRSQDDSFDFSRHSHPNTSFLHFHLEMEREHHQQLIECRTKKMLDSGLLDEIRQLLNNGFTGTERPLRSIGYKEGIGYLRGHIKSLDTLLERITISTRQLAKSQRTFFKKISPKNTILPEERKNIIPLILKNFYQPSRQVGHS